MSGGGGVDNHKQQWNGVVPPDSAADGDKIFRLNAQLHWEVAHEPLHQGIDSNRTCGVGPGLAFANAVKERVGVVGLVPCAVAGTQIKEWARGMQLYENMVKRVKAAAHGEGGGEIKALLWYQGEKDTFRQQDADSYKGNVERIILNVREDLDLPSLPVIVEENTLRRLGIYKKGSSQQRISTISIQSPSSNSDDFLCLNERKTLDENFSDPKFFEERAILAPTNSDVEMVNEFVLSLIPGDEKEYLSSDSICKSFGGSDSNEEVYSSDFLNTIRCSGIPNHILKLKVGASVMLLRNIDQSSGLCNGTRLVVTQLGNHIIEAKIVSGSNIGNKVFIPRMILSPSDSRLPFKFQRRQFPLLVCFAMTINKSQSQSLSYVGLFLPKPVFSHGQFYVVISRVKSKTGLRILCCDKDGNVSYNTSNVVYKEIFQNLK